MKKIIFHLIFLTFVFGFFVSPSWAGVGMVSRELSETGKQLYEEGDYTKAVHELSKALLADPTNKDALEYLHKMGLENGIYSQDITPVGQIGGLVEDIQGYQRTVADLEQETADQEELSRALAEDKDVLQNTVVRQENEKKSLRQEIENVQQEVNARTARIEELNKTLKTKGGEIVRLHTNLFDIKGRLVTYTSLAKEKEQVLKDLKKESRLQQKQWQRESRRESLQYEERLTALERDRNLTSAAATEAESQKHIIFQNLQDTIHEIRQTKDQTQEQLDLTSQELSFLEKKLILQDQKIADLDISMHALEEELESSQASLQAQLKQKNLYQNRRDENQRNIRWLKRKDRLIRDLKRQLVECRHHIRLYHESPTEKKEQYLIKFQGQLKVTQEKLQETSQLLKEKVSENQVLQQRLADTEQRLGIVEGLLKNKEGEIDDLEKQLTDVLSLPE